jgi:hypothetical protein
VIVVTIHKDNQLTDHPYRVEVSEPPDPAGEKVQTYFADIVDTTSAMAGRIFVSVMLRIGEDNRKVALSSQVAQIAADVVEWKL